MSFEPLSGIRVVDLTSSLAGPTCTQILAALDRQATSLVLDGDEGADRRVGPDPGGAGKRSSMISASSLSAAASRATMTCVTGVSAIGPPSR